MRSFTKDRLLTGLKSTGSSRRYLRAYLMLSRADSSSTVGEIVELRRSVMRQRYSNNPTIVLSQLRQYDNLEQRLVAIYNDLPGPLRLDTAATPVRFDMCVLGGCGRFRGLTLQAINNISAVGDASTHRPQCVL